LYVYEGTATINGGIFAIQQIGSNGHALVVNCYNESYTNGIANIEIKGGEFYGYDPSAYDTTEGNFVASGYEVDKTESPIFKVVPTAISQD